MKKVYLIAVVFALIAGFATYFFASEIDKKTTIKDADVVTVIVPASDIKANTNITDEMLADETGSFVEKTVLADDVYADAIKSKDELKNMVTVDKLYAGEQINKNRIESKDGADVALSLKLPEGMVAYSFSASSVTSVDGYISEGDTVDVIVYDAATGTSSVKFSGLNILRVSNNKTNQSASQSGQSITEYGTLTVLVSEDQALQLYTIENENTYKLVLNHRD